MLSDIEAAARIQRLTRLALRWAVPLSVLLLVLVQLRTDAKLFPSWIGWSDQDYYLRATLAWAHGNLDPAQHHYPPGYALLAAPFVYITPAQPFLIPNLFCSAAALILFTRIARHLSPDLPHGDVVAAACFLLCAAIGDFAVRNWVVPWSTTASVPLLLACLLLALRFARTIAPAELAAMGVAAGLCAMVRPTDAALVLAVCAVFCAVCLLLSRPAKALVLRCGVYFASGLCTGALPGLAAHVLVHGLSAGSYVGNSTALGFDWRLIPQRFVTLVVSPRPLFPEGTGMLAAFPWLLPGLAGMALAILPRCRPAVRANLLAASAVCAFWLLYLAYRDLQPYGLWRYNNVHYFLWTLPFFALWTVGLARAAYARHTRAFALAALAAATLLMCWRPVVVRDGQGIEPTQDGRAGVPFGLSPINRVFTLQASGDFRQIYFQHATLSIGGEDFTGVGYFRLFPVAGGFMLMPMRTLPAGAATLTVQDGVQLPARAHWVAGTARLVFGLPCLITPHRGDCKSIPDDQQPRRAATD